MTIAVRGTLYANLILIDTSAVIALLDPSDQFHDRASEFWSEAGSYRWCAVVTSSHETYTRARYAHGPVRALDGFTFFASPQVERLWFDASDEDAAVQLLKKYSEHRLSFQDALCAVLMLKRGVLKAFTFDSDFWTLGFEVVPGPTK